MLTMRQIEMFRAVMITKTVSGAAKLLAISQPGISRMLAHMEDRLEFRLFDRTRGRLVPTHEAEVLFEEIQQLYEGFAGLDHTVRRLAKGEDRLFRVGASPSLGHSVLPAMLARLSGNFPGLTLQFDILGRAGHHLSGVAARRICADPVPHRPSQCALQPGFLGPPCLRRPRRPPAGRA
jgi:DNA-binding transcriptional LysR family regulator